MQRLQQMRNQQMLNQSQSPSLHDLLRSSVKNQQMMMTPEEQMMSEFSYCLP